MLKQQAHISDSAGEIVMATVTDEGCVCVWVYVSVDHDRDDLGKGEGR